MALRIGDTLGGGIGRAFTYSGVVLMALLFVYQVIFTVAVNSLLLRYLPPEAAESSRFVLSAPMPPAVAGAGVVTGLLFGVVLYLIAARALTREREALDSLPAALFTRRIGRATLSAVGANLVVAVAVSVGVLLLVVPGVYLAISFLFAVFVVGVEDERAVDALRRSWALAGGDCWRWYSSSPSPRASAAALGRSRSSIPRPANCSAWRCRRSSPSSAAGSSPKRTSGSPTNRTAARAPERQHRKRARRPEHRSPGYHNA